MKKIILLIFCIFAYLQTASSKEYNDFQTWSFLRLKGDFNNPYFPEVLDNKLLSDIEFQYRLKESSTKFQSFLLRPSVGYKVGDDKVVWIGFAYGQASDKNDNNISEIRMFQMVTFKEELGKTPIVFVSNSRIEERFFENLPNMSLRFRQLLKLSFKLFDVNQHKIELFGQYAYFYNFLQADPSKLAGYDQTRVLLGIGYKTKIKDRQIEFSVGYMNNYNNDKYDQGINFGLSIALSSSKKQEMKKKKLEDDYVY